MGKTKENKYYVYALLGDRCTYPIVKINNFNNMMIDIEYKYNCFKKGSCDFSSCVRIINGNNLIENKIKEHSSFNESSAKLIKDLKNAECSEDYFTPIYVFDVTLF